MKKILYINVTYKNASTGRIIQDIVSAFDPDEMQYKVLFQIGNNQDENSLKFENMAENILRRGVHKFFGNVNFVTISETKRLISEIKKYAPDLIHIHTIHHQCTNYLMLYNFLKTFGKPVVITMHDCWIYTGGCYHYTEQGCNGFITGCQNCPKSKQRLECSPNKTEYYLNKKNAFYQSCPNIFFIGVSNWICNEAKKSVIGNKTIKCIRNGVDTERFKNASDTNAVKEMRSKLSNGRKYIVLGVASVWGETKGLSSFQRLAEALGDEYQVILVGGNLSGQSPSDNLTYYGLTTDTQELAYIYNSADVLVNMSIEESFGLVSAEAAVCGTPIVAYDSTANSEVCRMAEGSLISVGNEQGMLSEVKHICEYGADKKDITSIRHNLSKNRMIEEYIALYKQIFKDF